MKSVDTVSRYGEEPPPEPEKSAGFAFLRIKLRKTLFFDEEAFHLADGCDTRMK